MNKISPLLISIVLSIFATNVIAGSPSYTMIQGDELNVRGFNGNYIRSSDLICEDTRCYRIPFDHFAFIKITKKYQLKDIDFIEISELSDVKKAGNRLFLPSGLGSEIYRIAYKESIRELIRFDD